MNEKEIKKLVNSLGIGSRYKGYHYLVTAIKLCANNEDLLLSVSKLLYPEVARLYSTHPKNVERNLRTVVSISWGLKKDMLCGIASYELLYCPTVSEYLDILSFHLRA